jgi:hypothetical protein
MYLTLFMKFLTIFFSLGHYTFFLCCKIYFFLSYVRFCIRILLVPITLLCRVYCLLCGGIHLCYPITTCYLYPRCQAS